MGPTAVGRSYRSDLGQVGIFGRSWRCNLNRKMFLTSAGKLNFISADGRIYTYTPTTGHKFIPEVGQGLRDEIFVLRGVAMREKSTLEKPDGAFSLIPGRFYVQRKQDGTKFIYDEPDGYLVNIVDSDGNTIYIERHPTFRDKILSITNDLGRTLDFYYGNDPASFDGDEKVQTITDYAGRTRNYSYTGDLLTSVALGHRDLPTPRVTQYDYYSVPTTSDPALLKTITDPRGNIVMSFYFDGERVCQYDWGSGTVFLSYSDSTTTRIDPEGNVSEVVHNADNLVAELTRYAGGVAHTTKYTAYSNEQEVNAIEYPKGNQLSFTRNSKGMIEQTTHTPPTGFTEAPIIETMSWEPVFGGLRSYTRARGNVTISGEPQADIDTRKDMFSTYYIYGHENIQTVLDQLKQALNNNVTITLGPIPPTFGRPDTDGNPATFPTLDPAVYSDLDGDGYTDRGGNIYVVRGPKTPVVQSSGGTPTWNSTMVAREYVSIHNEWGQKTFQINTGADNPIGFDYYSGDTSSSLRKGKIASITQDTNLDPFTVNPNTGTTTTTVAGTHKNLTSVIDYDKYGFPNKFTSPGGFYSESTQNALGETISVTRYPGGSSSGSSASGSGGSLILAAATTNTTISYTTTFEHDLNGNITTIRVKNVVPSTAAPFPPSGLSETSVTEFVHTREYNILNMVVKSTTDARSNVTAIGDQHLSTRYIRNLNQQITRVIEPRGNYHDTEYDGLGLASKQIAGASSPGISLTTIFERDLNGNITKITDPQNLETVIDYDGFDRQRSVKISALNQEINNTYNGDSQIIKQTISGPLQIGGTKTLLAQTYNLIDSMGRTYQSLVDYFDPAGSSVGPNPNSLTTVPILHHSRLPGSTSTGLPSPTGTWTPVSTQTFDSRGLLTSQWDYFQNESTVDYDTALRVSKTTNPKKGVVSYDYDNNGNVLQITQKETDTSTETHITTNTFDQLDRLISSSDPLGNTRTLQYDSRDNVVEYTDAQGRRTHSWFDGAGRLQKSVRYLNGSPVATLNRYDLNSNVIEMEDAKGNITQQSFDHLDRPIRMLYADGSESVTTYNALGRVQYMRDQRGVVITPTYDAAGRVIENTITNIPYQANASRQLQTTFQKFDYNGLNQVVSAENNGSKVDSSYDSIGNLLQESQTIGDQLRSSPSETLTGPTKTISSTFDGMGRRSQLQYPGASALNFTYNALDQLREIKEGSNPVLTDTHSNLGLLNSRSFKNGITLHTKRDKNHRITRWDYRKNSDDQRIVGFQYGWNREDLINYELKLNRTTNTGETQGKANFYLYDDLDRLVEYKKASTDGAALPNNAPSVPIPTTVDIQKTYLLDQLGNRQRVTEDGTTTNYQMNLLKFFGEMNRYTRVGDSYQGYDNAGNLIKDGNKQYFFDYAGRLVQALTATQEIHIIYDAYGRRIKKVVYDKSDLTNPESSTVFWYDGNHAVQEEITDAAGTTTTREYLYGESIDEIIRMKVGAQEYYYHTNLIGNVVALTDKNGVLVESYEYSPYGEVTIKDSAGTVIPESSVGNDILFQSRHYDRETGLYYFRARYLDPQKGRFISHDPLMFKDSMNLYQAFGGNPVNAVDPWGEKATIRVDIHLEKNAKVQMPINWTGKEWEQVRKILREDEYYKELFDPRDKFAKKSAFGYWTGAGTAPIDIALELKNLKSTKAKKREMARRRLRIAGLYVKAKLLKEALWWSQFLAKKNIYIEFDFHFGRLIQNLPKRVTDDSGLKQYPGSYEFAKRYSGAGVAHLKLLVIGEGTFGAVKTPQHQGDVSAIVFYCRPMDWVWDEKKKKFVQAPAMAWDKNQDKFVPVKSIYSSIFGNKSLRSWQTIRHEFGHILGLPDVEGGGIMESLSGGGYASIYDLGRLGEKLLALLRERHPNSNSK